MVVSLYLIPKSLNLFLVIKQCWEEPFQNLSKKGQLIAFKHNGFWQCMDTMRDKMALNKLIKEKKAPWLKK